MKKITKLIIPVAGLGSRMLPATKTQPKEMMPVLNKPTIQYIVESAVRAGIKQVIFITSASKKSLEDHFDNLEQLEDCYLKAGKEWAYRAIKEPAELADFVFIRQKGPYGTGTAILNAKNLITEDEPFAVVYGDEIFDDFAGESHFRKLFDVYEKYQAPVLSVVTTDDEGTDKYGIIEGSDLGDDIYKVSRLLEKPGRQATSSRICAVGGYVLTPDIFKELEFVRNEKSGDGREFYLTDAIDRLIAKRDVYAKCTGYNYYDTGNKLSWLKANIDFGLLDPQINKELAEFLKNKISDKNPR